MTPRGVVNLVTFNAGWYACVKSTALAGPAVVGWLLVPNFYYSSDRRAELRLLLLAALAGTAADTALERAGLVAYAGGPRLWILCPLWITALWVNFATTLHGCLAWLRGRPGLAALLGAAAGPLTYLLAQSLGAVEVKRGGYVALAAEYALLLPLLFRGRKT